MTKPPGTRARSGRPAMMLGATAGAGAAALTAVTAMGSHGDQLGAAVPALAWLIGIVLILGLVVLIIAAGVLLPAVWSRKAQHRDAALRLVTVLLTVMAGPCPPSDPSSSASSPSLPGRAAEPRAKAKARPANRKPKHGKPTNRPKRSPP